MRPELEITGRAASEGVFAGPLMILERTTVVRRHSGSIAGERQALEDAVAAASARISALMANAAGEAVEILAFQAALLDDPALRAPALAAISGEIAADGAWISALDAEIAGYQASGEEYFRARAVDFMDIRDQVLRILRGSEWRDQLSGAVLAGDDLAPSVFLAADWSRGGAIALTAGSPSSHVAMLARARGVPMVVGLGQLDFAAHREIVVDGSAGLVILDPTAQTRESYDRRRADFTRLHGAADAFRYRKARRKDGSPIEVMINVASAAELQYIDPQSCDGIGLMRSEFLFHDGAPLPDEEEQYLAYRGFAEWANGRPVTIRTLDIGGDKPVKGLTDEGESNPFLGLRGVRFTLARPEVFRTQLRALARAAVHGAIKVMIPMVTVPEEFAATALMLDQCLADLRSKGTECTRPPLGIMVEVPAVAVAPELFRDAAFFSIGSNDLTQYLMAAARDSAAVSALNDPAHPAVLRLIASISAFGRANGMPVSLCGDMASEPQHLALLLAAGISSISVAPARLLRVKAALAGL